MTREQMMPGLRPVTLPHNDYQPSKAELEEPVDLRKPGGERPSPEELARAVLQPVTVKRTVRPE